MRPLFTLSGKKLRPDQPMSPYQLMILGGLQDKLLYQGTAQSKRKKPKKQDPYTKRMKRTERANASLLKHQQVKNAPRP